MILLFQFEKIRLRLNGHYDVEELLLLLLLELELLDELLLLELELELLLELLDELLLPSSSFLPMTKIR